MKKGLLVLALLFSPAFAVAGDQYMNCGVGNINSMESFIASSLLNNGRAYASFKYGKIQYTVTHQNGLYIFLKSDKRVGGFIKFYSREYGPFQESRRFDGLTCHIND